MSNEPDAGAVEVLGLVLEFKASAMVDRYAGGGHRSFGASTLELLAPPRLKGRRLAVYHDHAPPEDWRSVGAVLAFSIDAHYLDGDRQIFAGAVRGLVRAGSRTP